MTCVMCHRREAVCEIRGLRVCADSFCKYEAWTVEETDEMRGQWGGVNNSGNDADPRPHEPEKL